MKCADEPIIGAASIEPALDRECGGRCEGRYQLGDLPLAPRVSGRVAVLLVDLTLQERDEGPFCVGGVVLANWGPPTPSLSNLRSR